jgi:quercetin dioxygenase-like cupin family protein
MGGETFTPLVYDEDKFVMDWTMNAGGKVPIHVHEYSHEHFVVTKGIVNFTVNGTQVVKKVGEELFVPKGVPHGISNTTSQEIGLRVTYSPCADVHRMFEILSVLNTKSPGSPVNMVRYFYIYPRLGLKPFSTIPSPVIMRLLHVLVTVIGKLAGWDKLVSQFR